MIVCIRYTKVSKKKKEDKTNLTFNALMKLYKTS